MNRADCGRLQLVVLLATSWLVTPHSGAQAELPDMESLIREAEALAKEFDTEDEDAFHALTWEKYNLAIVHACRGNYKRALEINRTLDPFFKPASLSRCFEIELENTGKYPRIPDGLFPPIDPEDSRDWVTSNAAIALARMGRIEGAIAMFNRIEDNDFKSVHRVDLFLEIAEMHLRRNDLKGAANNLRPAFVALREQPNFGGRTTKLEDMVKLALQLNERELPKEMAAAASILLRDILHWKPNSDLAHTAARIGRIHALIGSKELAANAFLEATRIAECGFETEIAVCRGDECLKTLRFVRAMGEIASMQREFGFDADSTMSRGLALFNAANYGRKDMCDYLLSCLAAILCDGGDSAGANDALVLIDNPIDFAQSSCKCADSLVRLNRFNAAREFLDRAIVAIEQWESPYARAEMLTKAAMIEGKIGNRENAKRLVDKALDLARAHPEEGIHGCVSITLTELGFWEESYAVIREIPRETRLEPLTRLLRARAEKEHAVRKAAQEAVRCLVPAWFAN